MTLSALTSNARAVLNHALDATTTRTWHTAPNHLLRALLECGHPDPVAQLLAQLGIDRAAARSRLDQPSS